MNKKTLFYLIFFFVLLSIPIISLAGNFAIDGHDIHFEGLVPCGKKRPTPGESNEATKIIQEKK